MNKKQRKKRAKAKRMQTIQPEELWPTRYSLEDLKRMQQRPISQWTNEYQCTPVFDKQSLTKQQPPSDTAWEWHQFEPKDDWHHELGLGDYIFQQFSPQAKEWLANRLHLKIKYDEEKYRDVKKVISNMELDLLIKNDPFAIEIEERVFQPTATDIEIL